VSRADKPVAVVTGASRGAGLGIAHALGSHGCTVYVTGRTVAGTHAIPPSSTETSRPIISHESFPMIDQTGAHPARLADIARRHRFTLAQRATMAARPWVRRPHGTLATRTAAR